jgi:type IV secretory pathway TraG/TraD family ATPase VirD4
MVPFQLESIFLVATIALGFVALLTGIVLILRAVFGFRLEVNRSLNTDLEVVKLVKPKSAKDDAQRRPEEWRDEIGSMEQLLASLSHFKLNISWWKRMLYEPPTIVFEMANPSTSEEIFFYMAMPKRFREHIEKQVSSFFPDSIMEKVSDYTIFSPGSVTAGSVLGLHQAHALPLRTYETMDVDPLNELSNSLSRLDTESEGAVIQVILAPSGTEWRSASRSIAQKMQSGKRLKDAQSNSVLKDIGKSLLHHSSEESQEKKQVVLTPEEQELVKTIDQKASKSAFKVNIRLVTSAATQQRAEDILAHIESAFSQFANPEVNHFEIRKRFRKRSLKKFVFDYIFRSFDDEASMILNVEEIASFFHLPISTTSTPKIKWLKAGASPPPVNVPNEGILLGYNEYRGAKTSIRITDKDRRRHAYVIGQTGAGKSVFLQELAKQDAREGRGLCFIDPHGDAIEDILMSIPRERAEDVIVFDPSDTERPFGLNMLEYDEAHPEQKTFVINEMIGIFDQLYDLKATGGPMFEQYMRNAMLLIMDDPSSGSTLMEISKVLSDPDFRKFKISRCKNSIVVDFWTKEAEKAGGEASLANMVPYITSKLTTFISNDMMRPIIAQQKSTLNFREIMDQKKILLINLSKGKIGEINARLLGMVIVGKILMAALSRVDIANEDERQDFYLYLDEFQNVTTNSIAQILSEARKYHLILLLAHQFIGQLKEEISKAVFGNVGSMFAFRVGPEDGEFLEKQFAPVFAATDLVNVDNFQCFARVLMNNELTKPFSMKTFAPTNGDAEIAYYFKQLSRLRYGRDVNIVNREILDRTKIG